MNTPQPPKLGFLDRRAAAEYCGISVWTFDEYVRAGRLPRGIALAPSNAKLLWSVRALEDALARAGRSRKPKRPPRGIVRQRLERRQRARTDGHSNNPE
jgi:predicted DNA-binding transcriptional regulator AlpA